MGKLQCIATAVVLGLGVVGQAQEITVYSARHYGGDADLFGAFEARTGIKVNVLEAEGGALLERIKHEGRNCPADILITVDAARLGAADAAGLFQPVDSDVLQQALPASLRHPEGHWFGFGKRSRVLVIAPERVDAAELGNYMDLAHPRFKGRIVVRSSDNVYNQSLFADMLVRHGEAKATAWARGVLANMARPPQGNDRAQIRAVASGEADIAIVNHYYYANMLDSQDPSEVAAARKVVVHFPGQGEGGDGAHLNISGAGVLQHAPNVAGAIRFLEFLASPEGQQLFVAVSYEYPAVPGVEVSYPMFPSSFKANRVSTAELAANNTKALMIFDRIGWK